jgi:ABC-2 type transport system ATP-binding protein
MEGTPESVIKTKNCTKIYPNGTKAVDNVNVEIKKGEILGLLGRNGAGKTTLIRLLSGFFLPTLGDVYVSGKNTKHHKHWVRKHVGVVQQEVSYERYVTTDKNLYIYGQLLGIKKEDLAPRIKKVKEIFRLPEGQASELSAGNKKRLQVAREFLKIRPIMVLDEPTAGLDPIGRNQVLSQIKKLKTNNITVVYVTHILGEAELICDKIALMAQGQILHLAHPNELKNTVSHLKEIQVTLQKEVPSSVIKELPVENIHITDKTLVCRGHNTLDEINDMCKKLKKYGTSIEVKDLSLDQVFVELLGDDNGT